MKATTADVLNTAAVALGAVALWNIDAITAVAGPKVGLYALIAKGAAGWIIDTYKRVKAAREATAAVPQLEFNNCDFSNAAPPAPVSPPEPKP